jgi:ribose transport system substrate-binding protein
MLLTLASAVVLALFIAACGGGGSSSSSEAGGSGETSGSAETGGSKEAVAADPGLATAEREVKSHIKPPAHIGPTEPVENIPTGKTIVFSNCGVEGCVFSGEGLKAAAKVLGWTVETINVEPTPQGIQAFFEAAIRKKPDAVVSIGFEKSAFERQLAELDKMGIPVVSTSAPDEPGDGIVAQVNNPERTCEATELIGSKIVEDTGGEGTVGFATLTGYPIIEEYTECASEKVEELCPKCTIKNIDITTESLGVDSAEKLANWLRANSDIGHLFLSYGPLTKGLKAAVQNSGGELPELYTWSFSPEGLEALRSGELKAGVSQDYALEGWMIANVLANVFTGGNPKQPWEPWTLWASEYNNIPPNSEKYAIPPTLSNFEEQFEELWGMK